MPRVQGQGDGVVFLLGLLALYVADMFTGKPLYATAGVLGVLLAAMMAR